MHSVRYEIDNTKRTLHGALLDAQILADVYLAMTGGQTSMKFSKAKASSSAGDGHQRVVRQASRLRVVLASDEELRTMNPVSIWYRRRAAAVCGAPEKTP